MPTNNSVHAGWAKGEDTFGRMIPVGLLLAMLFTTLAFGAVEAWSVAVFGTLIAVLFLLWGVKCFVEKQLTLVVPTIAWPLVALIVLGLLQSISRTDESGKRFAISMDIEATRLLLELLVVLLAALLLFANFFTNEAQLSRLQNFLIFFGFALAIFGILQKLTWNGKYYWLIEPSSPPMAPFGSFVNHNHFAGYLEMIVPIPVALILVRAITGELSLFYGFAAVIMSVAIFFSLSRGGMISLVAGLVFVIAFGIKGWARMREDRRWASIVLPRLGAVLLIIGTIGAGVWWIGGDALIDRAEHTDLTGEAPDNAGKETFLKSRGWIWRDTVTMIHANWVTGVGLGAFETAYSLYSQHDGSMIVSQAHNDYLQVAADGGVAGGIIATWFLIILFRDFTRALSSRSGMGFGMALGCCGGIV
ncbi:MAG: O-antigen ligase family protein, partial [Acidobacteriota bacterium]|nr:O-antigen ligase family protein [Acidobacteriota bacterium]